MATGKTPQRQLSLAQKDSYSDSKRIAFQVQ